MKNEIVINKNQQDSELKHYQNYQKLLEAIERNHRKDVKRMCVFFIFLFWGFVAVVWISLMFIDNSFINELRTGNVSMTKNTDYLELVLPVLIAIVAAFIAFLGMNRLKDIDSQIDQIRSSINTELDKEIKRVVSLRSDLAEHIDVAVNNKTASFAENMENRLKKASESSVKQIFNSKDKVLLEISESKEAFVKVATQDKIDRDSFDQRYKWLLANELATKTTFLKEVATVYDVHQAIEAMWNREVKPNNVAVLTQRYVDKVTIEDSDLRGDEDDYHNLAAECARHFLYDLSCKVCETGLRFFPKSIDLLADWINYGTKLGNIDIVANIPLRHLLSIDKSQWNWRAFDFTVDFYLAAGMLENAEELANNFVLYSPYEERAYYCQAEVYQRRYAKEEGIQKTIAALQSAMDKNINCPMCASKLAELLCDCGRLDEALVAANRAIQELSQEQPSINFGYVVYRRALILDRLAYKAESEGTYTHELAVKAAIDYQVAINSKRLSATSLRQAKVRYDMLKTYFEIVDDFRISNSSESTCLDDIMEVLKGIPISSDS